MTLAERLRGAAAALTAAGVEQPRREARLLLCHATGLDAAALLRRMDLAVPAPGFPAMVARRANREPLAFITGQQPFWSFSVAVSADTLIPRADSESLIAAARALCPAERVHRVLDLGTGTGCLLLAALLEFPQAWGVGVDRSAGACALARHNAAALGLAHRASLLCADWAAPLSGRFELVLCNPPYVETGVLARLMPEVAWYEPVSALDGGADGLAAYRSVFAVLPGLLASGGIAIFELGASQASGVAELAEAAGLQPGKPHADLSGTARALPVWRPEKKSFGDKPDPR